MMQPVINGSVHEETPLISQQPPQGQQQHPYIKSDAAEQEQFSQEKELETTVEQHQTGEDESQGQTEESQEQTESENFTSSGRETEAEQTSTANANSNKPKTYANLFSSSFSSSLPPTSSQPPKMSVSPVSEQFALSLIIISMIITDNNTFLILLKTVGSSKFIHKQYLN